MRGRERNQQVCKPLLRAFTQDYSSSEGQLLPKSYKCSTAATTLETSLNFKQAQFQHSAQDRGFTVPSSAALVPDYGGNLYLLLPFEYAMQFFLLQPLIFLNICKSNYTYSPKGKLLYLPTHMSFPTLLYRLLKITAVARSLTALYPVCFVSVILDSHYSQN